MNELTIFKNDNFGEVRTLTINGEPYFCLSDVCRILELDNSSQVKKRLNAKGIILNDTLTTGGNQKLNFINEPNLYKCIFQSKTYLASSFQDWVCESVISQIRKSGMYIMAPKSYSDALRALANEVEEKALIKQQRDEAILTKTWISDKKTATAMNTASQISKEVNRLKMELARSKEFASIKAVEKITGEKFSWREIRDYCTAHELEMGSTFDANYGKVRAYPSEAWWQVYRIDLKEVFADVTKSGDCYD